MGPWWGWKKNKSCPKVLAVPADKQAKEETSLGLSVCDCRSELNKQTRELSKYFLHQIFLFFIPWLMFEITGLECGTLSKHNHSCSSDLAHHEYIQHLAKQALNSCRNLSR